MFYTYVWRDRAGVPFYVGKGVKRRAWNVSERSVAFKAVHAAGGCTVEIVDEFVLESEAHAHEMHLIEHYGRREFGGLLVNRTDGGEGASGCVPSAETCAKIAAFHRGKPHTETHKAKISAANRGKPRNAEYRAKISAGLQGKSPSAETRAKMRAARQGKPRSVEDLVKRAAAKRLSGPQSNNTLGLKGVVFDPRTGRYAAVLKCPDGKRRYLGNFPTSEEAACMYDAVAVDVWGAGNIYLNATKLAA